MSFSGVQRNLQRKPDCLGRDDAPAQFWGHDRYRGLGTIALQAFFGVTAGRNTQSSDPAGLVCGSHAAFLAGVVICLIVAVAAVFVKDSRGAGPAP